MKRICKKFNIKTGQNILTQSQILNDIKAYIGNYEYDRLVDGKGIELSGLILFDSPTQVKKKCNTNDTKAIWNDLISDKCHTFENEIISEITTSSDVTGYIELIFK